VKGSRRTLLRAITAVAAATLAGARMRRAVAQAPHWQGTKAMKIYLAGPLGFSEAGRAFHNGTIVPEVKRLGHVPFDPWSDEPPPGIDPGLATEIRRLGAEIKVILAMDYGAGKRDAWRKLNPRIGAKNRTLIDACDMVFAVLDGTDVDSGTAAEIAYAFAKGRPILGYRGDFRLSADNDGSIVNLQVEDFIRASGGDIITKFAAFETALAKIRTSNRNDAR
jgi:nucleoside 2-deoxyribosyltransferase